MITNFIIVNKISSSSSSSSNSSSSSSSSSSLFVIYLFEQVDVFGSYSADVDLL